jgi:uncharacterized protein YneF (UPF0154 family)
MPKSKLSALLSLSLVFFSGAILGAFANRLYMVRTVHSTDRPNPPHDPQEVRRHLVSEMQQEVKLDDQQVAELNQIYDETREQGDQVRRNANNEMRAVWDTQTAKIKAILRPDQVALYDALRARHDAARKREAERKQRHEGPGK